MGRRIRIEESGLRPDRMIVKIMRQLAMEFLEAKKPFVVDRRPIMARVMEARPMKGDKKVLSRGAFQEKKGRNATCRLSIN